MTLIMLISSIFPLWGVLLSIIFIFVNPSKWRKVLPLLVFGFFVGAYAFVPPDNGFDLYRYLPMIEQYGKLSFMEALTMDGDILYASHTLFWICGRLHLPHLAPAITTAGVYAAAFYMTCDTAERYYGLRWIGPVIIFQAAMMPYIMITNNVRNVFGLVMVALAVYLDIVKKDRKWYVFVLYATGILSHHSAFVFVVLRLLCGAVKKIFAVIVIFPLFFSSIIYFFNANINRLPFSGALGTTIRGIIWRMYGYLTYRDVAYAVRSLKSRTVMIDRVVMLIGMIMAIIIIFHFLRKGKSYAMDDSRIYSFVGMIAVMTISCNVFAMPNFWRFAAAFYAIFGVVAVPLLVSYKKMPIMIKIEPYIYTLIGAFSLLFQYVRYDRTFLLDWLTSGFLTNWITILNDFFKAI